MGINRKAAPKKKEAEMYALIDRWRNSDKTQQTICKEAGVSFQTFRYWLKKQNAGRDLFKETERFIPVTVDPTTHFEELKLNIHRFSNSLRS